MRLAEPWATVGRFTHQLSQLAPVSCNAIWSSGVRRHACTHQCHSRGRAVQPLRYRDRDRHVECCRRTSLTSWPTAIEQTYNSPEEQHSVYNIVYICISQVYQDASFGTFSLDISSPCYNDSNVNNLLMVSIEVTVSKFSRLNGISHAVDSSSKNLTSAIAKLLYVWTGLYLMIMGQSSGNSAC